MKEVYIRIGAAAVLLGILFVFFVPVVYSSNLYADQMYAGSVTAPSNPAGLNSIWAAIFGLGAVCGFEEGYSASIPYLGLGSLTTSGLLLLVVLPMLVATVGCMAPEIVKKSLATRIGFAVFGGGVFTLSVLVFASMLGNTFNSLFATYGVVLFSEGSLMVIYGIRPAIFQSV